MIKIEKLGYDDKALALIKALKHEIIVLDGATGTMLQRLDLSEADFGGHVRDGLHGRAMKGCNDMLCITRPDVIEAVHRDYIDAGARIITTNSFNANALSLSDYGVAHRVRDINLAAAQVARRAVDSCSDGVLRWVAGSMGPTGKSLSMTQGIDDPSADPVTWDVLVATYIDQALALIEGGADLLLIETVYDGLNAKACIWAARRAMEKAGRRVPLMISATLTESGRTLAGQTLEALVATVAHGEPVALGLNCSFGADAMMRYVESLRDCPFAVSVYPNAGLPNAMGEYDETPDIMAGKIEAMLDRGLVNIVGGCCGTTPDHIRAIADIARRHRPRVVPPADDCMTLAGLEPLRVEPLRNFLNVGERCNVAGSRKFLRLIKEGAIDEAVDIARSQVDAGAQVIDVNMDDAMLDASRCMSVFVSRIGVEPDVARVPLMIDSSGRDVVMSGLKCVQGRPIVNSISLKEGETKFVEYARDIREMGASVIVMAFDEQGQADTFQRRIEVCSRAYRLLTEVVGFRGCDIVFDPNILAVATGIEAHDNYALDFIRAVSWIKENLPGAKVSGGVSNLSFSFRGNTYVREAMHSVFLSHAIARGMDMGIVNAAAMLPVDQLEPSLREAVDDVLLNRRPDATERLVAMAEEIKARKSADDGTTKSADTHDTTDLSPSDRIERMLVRGSVDGLDEALAAAMAQIGSAVGVIDGPLMRGMNKVGELFGAGKMFLPQVVKSARTMKHAVAWLTPMIEEEKRGRGASSAGRMVIATVKGDVHDIGKNIVNVIMNCNGYDMIDMGVMVPGEDIVDRAIDENADFIGLSGLITPSLDEMCHVARLMEIKGLRIPLLIGGATTSALHTAVKIAPCYGGPVVYTRDAAMMPGVAQRFANPATRSEACMRLRDEQERLRREYAGKPDVIALDEARRRAPRLPHVVRVPKSPGCHRFEIGVAEARSYINWRAFMTAWKLDASLASVADIDGCDHCRAQWLASMPSDKVGKAAEAMQLLKEARRALDYICSISGFEGPHGAVCIVPAHSESDDIVIDDHGSELRLPTLRQQAVSGADTPCLALADYLAPADDWIGLFAVTAGAGIERMIERYKTSGDDYKALLYQTLADRLVEAATEIMHRRVRRELWGYAVDESENPGNALRQYYEGIRPAIGYPSLPDQSLVFLTDRLLDYAALGIEVTESGAMKPASSTTGLIFAHPDAHYFVLGDIGRDQRDDYARRRGLSPDIMSRFLPG